MLHEHDIFLVAVFIHCENPLVRSRDSTTSMKENNPSNVIYIHHKAPVIETLKPHQDTASHALFDLKT